jgi:hypothetical protein
METPPLSPRQGSKGRVVQREVSSSKDVVSRVDVNASRKLRYLKKRADMKMPKKVVTTNIILKPRAHRNKQLVFSDAKLVVEAVHAEDPYDNLTRKRFERRSSAVVESPAARTGTMKLLRPRTRRRKLTELSRGVGVLPELIQEVRTTKAELMPQENLGEYLDLRRLEELTPHLAAVEGNKTPSRGTMYRLTHRRTASQKDIKSSEVQWDKLNSKRAERVWQWKGAYGSLAKLHRR